MTGGDQGIEDELHMNGEDQTTEGDQAEIIEVAYDSSIITPSTEIGSSSFVCIEVGESMVVDDPDGSFSVTAFDANHCPGAVMFLFEGNFGNILHTGDCRLTPECLQNLPEKYIGKKGREPKSRLDYVFLDCTFGNSSVRFPSKYSAIRQVINCIWKHPDAPLVYLTCDLLGQEEILMEVSRIFGPKIYVDKITSVECFRVLSLTAPDILCEDPTSRFQVFGFPKFLERAQAKLTEARINSKAEPLFIRPSAQWYACDDRKPKCREAEKDSFGVWHVCYSIHSSQEELEWALQLLQPKNVVSTTPGCRAMELNYVKNHCLTKTQVTSDDPLWKLLDITVEVGSTSPIDSSLPDVASINLEIPAQTSSEIKSPRKVLSTSVVELSLNLSPSKRPPITLFGRARFGLEGDKFLHEPERIIVPTKIDEPPVSPTRSEEPELASQELSLNPDEGEEKKIEAVRSFSHSCVVESPKRLDECLRKLYRSMNVPVPRPLPSLVELMNSRKRAKRSVQF
ncbi:hypothetical protein GIB67_029807 [Kingdonia uniflora]|uniref:DNA repair metallo-beta-lactamase domain-containing protein n=1 Tax=Kingdonia uniflora TaxID=39325 RepID=A0A7J7NIX3_9MAGN|nr:hypothetical protein GIB67_029807 [Kingdonia uniflora]